MKKNIIKTSTNQKQNGFGLLEVLLSAGLIAILIGGAVVLGAVVFRTTQINQHKTQSLYLNQEAIEAVKQIQRTNWIKQDSNIFWDKGLVKGDYVVLKNDKNWVLNSYSEEGSKKTLNGVDFFRKVSIYDIKADSNLIKNEAFRNTKIIKKMVCEVSWQDYGKTLSTKTETIISDWKSL